MPQPCLNVKAHPYLVQLFTERDNQTFQSSLILSQIYNINKLISRGIFLVLLLYFQALIVSIELSTSYDLD